MVVARFVGPRQVIVRELADQRDERGRIVTGREVITSFDLAVEDTLAGEPLRGSIQVATVGGSLAGVTTPMVFAPPAPGTRVVIGLVADANMPGGWVIAHARGFEAEAPEELARLQAWVADGRAPAPIAPEEVEERLHQLGIDTVSPGAANGPSPFDLAPSSGGAPVAPDVDVLPGPVDPGATPQAGGPDDESAGSWPAPGAGAPGPSGGSPGRRGGAGNERPVAMAASPPVKAATARSDLDVGASWPYAAALVLLPVGGLAVWSQRRSAMPPLPRRR